LNPKILPNGKSELNTETESVLCLGVTLHVNASHQDIANSVRHIIAKAISWIGIERCRVFLDEEGEPQAFDAQVWENLAAERFSTEQDEQGLRILGTDSELNDVLIYYWGWQLPRAKRPYWRNTLHFRVPASSSDDQGLLRLMLASCATLPVCSGHAGFHLAMSQRRRTEWEPYLRYLGVDLHDHAAASAEVGDRISGVHWLTVVGQAALESFGGATQLRKKLAAEVTLHEIGNSAALLQLGNQPVMGDSNRGDLLPLYRDVARVLEPQLYWPQTAHLFDVDCAPDEFTTKRWYRRFLE
jgi:hypothetical protein